MYDRSSNVFIQHFMYAVECIRYASDHLDPPTAK